MKSYRLSVLALITIALLSACSSSTLETNTTSPQLTTNDFEMPDGQESASSPTEANRPNKVDQEEVIDSSEDPSRAQWPDGELQLDEQGSVEVTVTPLNLNAPNETLSFNVGLNTHSVDLSMDLALLATLEADNGLGVQAALWDAPSGGHHVSGILSFPASVDGAILLDGATYLTLTIRDVDAPERTFKWNSNG